MNWEIMWKVVLVFTLSSYSVLVVFVFFGGIRNLRDMFRDFRSEIDRSE
ncbi:hypothetical protein ACFL6I_07395 [candidate division KSB1 bacterium]